MTVLEAQFVHVPGGRAIIHHEVEGTSHVGVAVVTKQIVLGGEGRRDQDSYNCFTLHNTTHLRPAIQHGAAL